jgi:soluble lytic murein transglycosylase-like protein
MTQLLRTLTFLCLLLPQVVNATGQPATDHENLRLLLKEAIDGADSFEDRFEAEVWLLDMSNRLKPIVKDDKRRLQLLRQIHYEATRVDLPPELVLAVIEVESRFDPFAISSAGALGLMQVMPFWLKEIGRPEDNLFDIHTNLRMGCTILRYYLDKSKGNLTHALARYNGSLYSHRYTSKVFRALDRRWRCIDC